MIRINNEQEKTIDQIKDGNTIKFNLPKLTH